MFFFGTNPPATPRGVLLGVGSRVQLRTATIFFHGPGLLYPSFSSKGEIMESDESELHDGVTREELAAAPPF